MRSYNELFIDEFHNSQIIDETYADIYNNQGFKEAILYLKSIGATKLDTDNYNIKYWINKWTQSESNDNNKDNIIQKLKRMNDYVTDVRVENNDKFNIPELIIETKNGPIKVLQLSERYPKLRNPYLKNENARELFSLIESEKRKGRCFEFAYCLTLMLPLLTKLTTGYIYGFCDKSKFLHSWVETTIDGEEYVIDGTLNAIINKDGYYLMGHAKVINQIDKDTFLDDLNKYEIINNVDIPLSVYYVFRDEIIKDLERNQDVFKKL